MTVSGRGRSLSLCVGAAALLVPAAALAHPAERGLVMLLPTGYYLIGGGLAVAISFAVLRFVPGGALLRVFRAAESDGAPGRQAPSGAASARVVVSCASFLFFLLLLAAGLAGTRDPLTNPLPLVVWTGLWVALTLVQAVAGDLWRWLNPWSGPLALLRRIAGQPADAPPPLRLPAWIGHAPAIASLFAIIWFELVDLAPDDPARLARAAGLYWALHFLAMLLFGEADWRRRGEALSVFFGFVARLAPWRWTAAGGLRPALPGRRVVIAEAPGTGGALFVLLALAGVSFDGLSKTFVYLDAIGINPLAFPGRSAVTGENTFGLLAMAGALAGAYFGAAWLGDRLAGGDGRGLIRGGGALVFSLLPISLAYHFAHYLTALLINAQYALLALDDPFGTGLSWLGVEGFHVVTSFLNDYYAVRVIWNLQAGAIVLGHVWAVLLAHALAVRAYGDAARAARSQLPLAAVMVGYTVFGLWLLSAPTGA